MRNIIKLLILSILLSCGTNSRIPYPQGDTMIYKDGVDRYVNTIVQKLKQDKLLSAHMVIVYQPLTTQKGNLRFRAIAYDSISKARNYLTKDQPGQQQIITTTKTWRFIPMDYMLNYHLAGKDVFLKSLNQHGSEGSLVTNIYDIDYSAKHTRSYQLELVFFSERGKPLSPQEYFLEVDAHPDWK